MKKLLLILMFHALPVLAQPPVIEGDTMLCPDSNGTAFILQAQLYDTYSWHTKLWFTSDAFEPVAGENNPSFTYDWYTYDQSLIKAVVTIGDQTFESNVIQVDSYAWLPISVGYEDTEAISINPDNGAVMLCEGTSFTMEVFNPYTTNIQWYKDGVAINNATSMTYEVSSAGTYHVTAAPPFCPDNSSTSLPMDVTINTQCGLGTNDQTMSRPLLYPNPATNSMQILNAGIPERVSVYNMTGQRVAEHYNSGSIDVSELSHGIYIIEIKTDGTSQKMKLIKQ